LMDVPIFSIFSLMVVWDAVVWDIHQVGS
jgi:hypothetical protein